MKLIALFLTGAAGIAGAQDFQPDPARRVRERLASTRISLDFTDARLAEVIAYFQEFSGLNFHVEEGARARDEEGARITIKVKDVSMRSALRLILHPRELRCVLRAGVIVVTTKDRLESRMTTRVYDAREVMSPLRDFAGPYMELQPPGSGKMGVLFDPLLMEDPKATLDPEFLVDLIKTCIGDQAWEGAASILQVNGLLIVTQSRAVHGEVQRLLDRLRMFK